MVNFPDFCPLSYFYKVDLSSISQYRYKLLDVPMLKSEVRHNYGHLREFKESVLSFVGEGNADLQGLDMGLVTRKNCLGSFGQSETPQLQRLARKLNF